VNHRRLLFYNKDSGLCAVGRFLGNGDYEDTGSFSVAPGWPHVIGINHRRVQFPSSATGETLVGRVEKDCTWTQIGQSSGFGHGPIVASDGDHVVFYQPGPPYGYTGSFDPKTDYWSDFLPNWTMATATHGIAQMRALGQGKYCIC
jgi:hypothetical protein